MSHFSGMDSYQHRLSLLRVGAVDGGEVGVGVPLLRDSDGRRKVKSPEGLLDEGVADAVEGRVHHPQRTRGVRVPVGQRRHTTSNPDDHCGSERVVWGVCPRPSLLPVEAQRAELIHVAAIDALQRIAAARCQPLVPAGGAPGLQVLLNALQDLLVQRRADLGAVAPVHLQGEAFLRGRCYW